VWVGGASVVSENHNVRPSAPQRDERDLTKVSRIEITVRTLAIKCRKGEKFKLFVPKIHAGPSCPGLKMGFEKKIPGNQLRKRRKTRGGNDSAEQVLLKLT